MSKKRKKDLKRVERRKLELEHRIKKTRTIIAVSVMLIVTICVIVYASMFMGGSNNIQNFESTKESNVQSGNEVVIPLSEISDNAEFYNYNADGVIIRYFAVKGSDGDVHVAFNACDICYDQKKGYRQVGEMMQCINCGNEYIITGLGTENIQGGCWPSYLPVDIDEDNVVIAISDLENKRYMFA
ncbi:MAG: DUF2318 domain-containing protein [Candidatus Heimdallarchaeota archaeon]|nr:DUF2318 domain-containing protein [Candidatus Heimdallarchaeota archaeon]MCK4876910.1 DUF2318 domain-containing protein [Candidatus Heimdallarchaeota archaeon]